MKSVITYREHDFKEAKQLHCRKLIAFTDQFALKKTLIKIKLRIFWILCLFSFRAPPGLLVMHAAPMKKVKVDPLRPKVFHPLPDEELSFRQNLT